MFVQRQIRAAHSYHRLYGALQLCIFHISRKRKKKCSPSAYLVQSKLQNYTAYKRHPDEVTHLFVETLTMNHQIIILLNTTKAHAIWTAGPSTNRHYGKTFGHSLSASILSIKINCYEIHQFIRMSHALAHWKRNIKTIHSKLWAAYRVSYFPNKIRQKKISR